MTALVRAAWTEVTLDDTRVRLDLAELPPTDGDPRLLRQIWVNLLGNAVKFSAHTPDPLVRVHARQDGALVHYTVADNGVGFDSSRAGRLFEPFRRMHRQDEYPGTGIGLATVRRIVERHGGQVHVESEPGHGARFTVTLPAAAR